MSKKSEWAQVAHDAAESGRYVFPARATLSGQLASQHELLMAALTKTPPRGKRWEVTVDQQKIGDLKGQWLGSLTVSPEDEEDWPQFLGRWQKMLDDLDRELIRRNLTMLERQLEESVKE